jgi:pyruvate-formate lyase-activating enzyme
VRVLILHPPLSVGHDFVDYPWATDLGAVQLAAVLRSSHEVVLLDAFAVEGADVGARPGGGHRLGLAPARLLDLARAHGPFDAAVVALTPFHRPPRRDDLLGEVCAGLRAHLGDAPLLLADCHQGGQHSVEADGGMLLASYPEVDAWVKHEAELTVPALLAALADRGVRPAGVHAGVEADLAGLAAPAWELVDLAARDRFQRRLVEALGRPDWPFPLDGRTLPAVTSRGCPFDCLHCTSNPGRAPGAPKTQRRLPPVRVRALLEALARRHGATRLWLLDELINASPGHLATVLEAAEALDLPLELPNGLRADLLSNQDLPRLRGRLTTLSVSAESGVQRVVDEVVGKRLDLAAVERVAAGCASIGLPLLVHYIIGLPGETPEEINATLAHAADLEERHGIRPAVQFATPLPGSRLAKLAPPAPAPDDFGPRFQALSSHSSHLVPAGALARFLWAFERRVQPGGARKLVLNLTYRCNNHCAFCAVGNRPRRDGELARQLEALERSRREGATLLDLDGGEPTLHPGLFDVLARARALGYQRISVTTNGRRCAYGPYAQRLVRAGVSSVLVSLHGPDAATHGDLVGVPEAFDQTTEGIRQLVAAAPAGVEIGVNTTVVRGNVDRLTELAALVHSLGVRWLNLQFLTPFGRATRDQAPDPAVAAAQTRRFVDAWGARLRLGIVNLPLCQLPGHEALVAPDLGKRQRHMVFVNDEEVNLAAYLAARRSRRPECAPCPFAACCAGFYDLPEEPEAAWPPPIVTC